MHEFSLAQGLARQLHTLAAQHHARRVCTVRVAIGSLAGIVADSFAFGFEVLCREDQLLAGAALEISETAPHLSCLDCGQNMPLTEASFACTGCGSHRLARQGGDDLILTQVEME